MRKFSDINFNCTCWLHLVLVIRTYFDENLIHPEIQVKITLRDMFNMKYFLAPNCRNGGWQIANFHLIIKREWPTLPPPPPPPNLRNLEFLPWCKKVLYQIQQQIYKFLCILFFNWFQTKHWSYHWLKIITGDWITIWLNFPFKYFSMFRTWFIV